MKRKSWKKYLSISAAVLLGMSALTGCGEKPAEGSGAEESIAEESESSAESTMQESESSSEESAQPDAAASTDPLHRPRLRIFRRVLTRNASVRPAPWAETAY